LSRKQSGPRCARRVSIRQRQTCHWPDHTSTSQRIPEPNSSASAEQRESSAVPIPAEDNKATTQTTINK